MHHKTSIERILAIEEAMDVTAVRYKGLQLWPYVRMQLWQRLMHPEKYAPPATIGLKHLAGQLSQSFFKPSFYAPYLEHTRRHREIIARLTKAGPVDVLLFSKEEDYRDKVKARYYNRFIDPIAELIKTKFTYRKIELSSESTSKTLPRYEHTLFLDALDYLRRDAQRSLIAAFQKNGDGCRLEGGGELTRLLASVRFDLALTEEYLMVEAERILHFSRYFREILKLANPKVVFLAGYNSDLSMALVRACKNLGIKSVSIQQSGYGAYHGLYTHWQHLPEEGYTLVPDYFWCWSKIEVEYMMRGRGHVLSPHLPVIGGNLWLEKWAREEFTMPQVLSNTYLKKMDKLQRIILVSLQAKKDCIPDTVIDAIRSAPTEWLWMLRIYPGMEQKIDEITALFADLNIDNVEISMASRMPLYQLLKHIDWHVSEGSTVCVEALRWGVPSVLLNPHAKESFARQLADGVFVTANSSEELIETLHETPPMVENNAQYIVTDRMYALDTVLEIMNPQVAESVV